MRETDIIQDLKDSSEYRNLDYFAQRFAVSTRTISNDMKYLMQIASNNGFELLLKRGEGYYLKVNDPARLAAFLHIRESQSASLLKDRITTIITMLLLTPDYLTQDTIADELQVSRSMIKLDMSKVEERVKANGLSLDKKAHYGICLRGSYQQRKQYLLTLMEQDEAVEERINRSIDADLMKQIDKTLISALRQYDLNINYTEMIKLEGYLKITMMLCRHEFLRSQGMQGDDSRYWKIALELKAAIESLTGVHIYEQDICDIASYLHQKTKPNEIHLDYDEQLKADICSFLAEADREYDTAFLSDEEFLHSLFAHVSLLVDRLHQSISFDNPLVKEISVKYPVIFNISIKFANMLEERYQVKATQGEIGFIATHLAAHLEKEYYGRMKAFNRIAIICSSGGGSAYLIKLKMETIFPDSELRTFSFMELDDVHRYSPDIIFTIRELDESFDVPIVMIKELLDDKDIHKIKNMFEFCGPNRSVAFQNSFLTLFHKEAFWVYETGSYLDIIQDMAIKIEQLDVVLKGYHSYVMQREAVLSTVYNNGVAIPHPIEMCGRINMLGMGIIKHDLRHENKPVKLIFLVSLKRGNLKMHQDISRTLFDVMSDERLIEKIRNSISYDDFIKNVSVLSF